MKTTHSFDPLAFAAALGVGSHHQPCSCAAPVREKYTVRVGDETLDFAEPCAAMVTAESAYRAKGLCSVTAELSAAHVDIHMTAVVEKIPYDDGREGETIRISCTRKKR